MWHEAVLARAKRLPAWESFVGAPPQTPKAQAAVWRHAAEVFGLSVRKHRKGRVKIIRFPRSA
jgi:hypothetical protein